MLRTFISQIGLSPWHGVKQPGPQSNHLFKKLVSIIPSTHRSQVFCTQKFHAHLYKGQDTASCGLGEVRGIGKVKGVTAVNQRHRKKAKEGNHKFLQYNNMKTFKHQSSGKYTMHKVFARGKTRKSSSFNMKQKNRNYFKIDA